MKNSVKIVSSKKSAGLGVSVKDLFYVLLYISVLVVLINIGYKTGVIVNFEWLR